MPKYEGKIEELLADDSFVAWLEGTAPEKEAAKWEAWLKSDPAKKELVEAARSLHRSLKCEQEPRPEVEQELFKLKEKVAKFEEAKEKRKEIEGFQTNRKKSYSSVAAVIILLVAVSVIIALFQTDFYQSEAPGNSTPAFITESTQNGQQKVLTLSDGSTITLNSNSSLKYPVVYSGGDLEVWLEGEAYFDIVHKTGSDKRSFSVHVSGGSVEVFGTKFNVNTYEEDTEVVLVQGRVNIKKTDSLDQITDSYLMQPGELSRISQISNAINTSKVEAERFTAWTQGKLMFDHTPLTKVVERVKHIYGVRFQLNGYNLKETLISGSLPNDNLEVFLNTLENMLDCPVMHKDGRIVFKNPSICK